MNKLTQGLILLSMSALTSPLFSQASPWTTQKTKDGQTTVTSQVSNRVDDTGKTVLLLEFKATTIAKVDFAKCVAVMKDLAKHATIVDAKESLRLKAISDSEWLVYYNFNAPWPLPGSDAVATMRIAEDSVKQAASFTLTAAPGLYPLKKDVARMTFYNASYSFQDLGQGRVEITTTARTSPAIQVPEWMVTGYFPEGPASVHKVIIGLASQ